MNPKESDKMLWLGWKQFDKKIVNSAFLDCGAKMGIWADPFYARQQRP